MRHYRYKIILKKIGGGRNILISDTVTHSPCWYFQKYCEPVSGKTCDLFTECAASTMEPKKAGPHPQEVLRAVLGISSCGKEMRGLRKGALQAKCVRNISGVRLHKELVICFPQQQGKGFLSFI